MTGFETGSSAIGSDRAINCATTSGQQKLLFAQIVLNNVSFDDC